MSSQTANRVSPQGVLVNFCRILIGLTFLFSGIVKAVDPVGTQIKLSDYLYAFGMGGILLDSTLLIFSCLLAGIEILIGAYMTTGVFSKGASLITLIMMSVLTPFTLYIALKNPVEECGCFGDALVLTNWQTFSKNIFLLAMAILVFVRNRLVVPFVIEKRQWIVTLFTVAIAVRFMAGNISGLPVLDFRAYKVGTDLRYEVLESANPAMADFTLMDQDYNDLTVNVLNDSGYTFLLVSPHLETASETNVDLIDDVFDYCEHYGYNIIGVTASGADAIAAWNENAGVDMEFMRCDEIPLQTMVRSNPGLVLLHDGILINKWSHGKIPQDDMLSGPIEELSIGTVPQKSPLETPWAVGLLFLLPLFMIVLIDWLRRLIQ